MGRYWVGTACLAVLVGNGLLTGGADAAQIVVNTEDELRDALTDGPAPSTITLLGNLTLLDPAPLAAPGKQFIVDTGNFFLRPSSSPAGNGKNLTFEGGEFTFYGTILGGMGDVGGAGLALVGGSAINNGTIAAGLSGNSVQHASAVVLNGSSLVNNGTIAGINPEDLVRMDSGSILTNEGTIETNIVASGGATIINDGTIQGHIALNGGGNTLELRGGSVITSNTIRTVSSFGSNDSLVLGGSVDASFNNTQIGGPFPATTQKFQDFDAFVKTGSSTWILTGSTGYRTPWRILGGTLSISSDANLGGTAAGPVGMLTFDGGALRNTAALSSSRNAMIEAGGGTLDTQADLTWSGVLAGAGGLNKIGGATLTLGAAETYTGGTTISDGTLALGAGGSLAATGSLGLAAANTAFDMSAANSQTIAALSGVAGSTIALGPNTLTFGDAANQAFAGAIGGAGGLVKQGDGIETLDAANSFAGGIALNGGGLILGNAAALGTGALTVTATSSLDTSVPMTLNNPIVLNNSLVVSGSNPLTLAGALSGPGALTKNGAETLTLTGPSSHAGGTTINAGVLEIAAAPGPGALTFGGGTLRTTSSMALSQPVLLSAGGTFEAAAGTALTMDGTISGPGQLTKSGDGTMVLAAPNSYAGGTLVLGGNLVIDEGSLPDDAEVDGGAFLVFDQAADGTYTGTISGAGGVVVTGNGTLTLTAAQTYTGQTRISGEALQATTDLLNADITIDADKALILNQDTTGTYSHVLSGAGGLVKTGSGIVFLSGANTYMGPTAVNAGALRINGTVGGPVVVAGGALLGGTGTIGGAATINAGGIHAPGNSIGTQTIMGNYANHGTLQVEVDPAHADSLVVGGTVDVTGARLDIALSSNDAALWDHNASPYTIIQNGSGTAVVGNFASITDLLFLTAALDYAGGDGNDIDLILTRNTTPFPGVAGTHNQQVVASAVEAQGAGAVYDAILGAGDADLVRKSFDALSGEVHASLQGVLLQQGDIVTGAMTDRLRAAFDGAGASVAPVLSYGPNGPQFTTADTGDMVVWGHAVGTWGKLGGNHDAAGVDIRMGRLLAGADALVGDWRLGLLAGYGQTGFDIDGRSSSGSSDDYLLGLYGGTQLGGLNIRTGLAYGWHDVSTSRTVPLLNQTLTADYGASTIQAFGELGYGFDIGSAVRFEPYASLAYVRLDTDGFGETGGSAALSGNGSSADAAFTTIGVRASTEMHWGETQATLRGGLGWRHAFSDDPTTLNAFAGGGDFRITGAPLTRDSAVVEAGLDLGLSANASLGLTYKGQFADGIQNHALSARLTVGF
ncbi:MAG TPA: autotransporter domain-containing protein [Devosiaceae bacterium]|jgi:autotransporter-associated beta strand protein